VSGKDRFSSPPCFYAAGFYVAGCNTLKEDAAMSFLEMKGITRIYPGVIANNNVDFTVEKGEIHALLGENGAGKSTLMKILFGLEKPDKGTISLNNQIIKIVSPFAAIEYGIGMVHQHFMLAENLTVTENIILGNEPNHFGIIDNAYAKEKVRMVIDRYNFKLDPDGQVGNLSVSAKQKVEILKALARGSKILILDEPTAVLTPQETEELFNQLNILKQDGYTIIFISHKLNEIKKICGRGTVMRSGKVTGVFKVADVSLEEISRLMIGRVVTANDLVRKSIRPGPAVLTLSGVSLGKDSEKLLLEDISFMVKSGEIFGIVGVEGNGQNELVRIITGFEKDYQGKALLGGREMKKLSVRQIRAAGLSHIPEDRMLYGAAKDAVLYDNIISTTFEDPGLSGMILQKIKAVKKLSEQIVRDFNVKTSSIKDRIGNLSGGNIQKVIAAREMYVTPKILVANQPTRGIDMGASMYIRQKLLDLKAMGAGIVLLSADMPELLSLADKVLVLYGGRISAFFNDIAGIDEEKLGWYLLGVKRMSIAEITEGMMR
jgi:simple sugar transport system ATP-binding protein